MKHPYSLGVIAALAFAGCGGAGTAVPQGAMTQSRAHEASSSSGDLLYMAAPYGIMMLSYPDLKVVSTIMAQEVDGYGCVDSVANVVYFQTNLSGSGQELAEYPIGSTQSVGSIIPPSGYYFAACSADQTTGNIAVIVRTKAKSVYVAIYSSGTGQPQKLRDSRLQSYNSLTYDKAGNLFVIGGIPTGTSAIVELRKGARRFVSIVHDGPIGNGPLQSDGKYLISERTVYGHITVYRLTILRAHAKIVNTTILKRSTTMAWIQGNRAVSFRTNGLDADQLALYGYPEGKLVKTYHELQEDFVWGAIVAHNSSPNASKNKQ